MAGETLSTTLSGALPSIIADARIVREFDGVWQRTCDMKKLKKGTGLSWQEFTLQQIDAQDITETTRMENSQIYAGVLLSSTPQMTQIMIKVTDRTYEKVATVVTSKFGSLAGNAMKRKKDEDYLSLFSTFATTASPGTGNPLSFGHITAAVANARSNVTEGTEAEMYAVLHGFQVKDIQDEILQGVGTYTVPQGMTAETFRKGFTGTVAGANVFTDDNITITATPDAFGAVHAREGVVAIQGASIKTETRRDPSFGGGADEVFMTDDYSFVERTSAGTQTWCYLIRSDATAPTS
jgi:hypothetical protein